MSGEENERDTLASISESIKSHQTTLDSLKDVPSILQKLSEAVGLKPDDNKEVKQKTWWSLGLSDDEDESDQNNLNMEQSAGNN